MQSEQPQNFAWRLQPSRRQLVYPLLPAEAAPELAPHLDYRMPRRGKGTLQSLLSLGRPHLHVARRSFAATARLCLLASMAATATTTNLT